ncbi:glycoside hydrolase family 36 protein [Caldanaerobius fijiensis]|nr:glycoside hydrolase family 36 protein [Caldanaerobius fijiensis]
MSLSIEVQHNGAFTIQRGSFKIVDCFPGIDEKPIKTLGIEVKRQDNVVIIEYKLIEGSILLKLITDGEQIVIESTLFGFSQAPRWFYPVFQAEIEGIRGLYRQGFGLGGPSGYTDIDELEGKEEKADSFGMIALQGKNVWTYFFAKSHDRFMNRYDVQCISRDEVHKRFSAGFRLENIPDAAIELPSIYVFCDENLERGLENTAKMIGSAMNARNVQPPAYHWCSWYYLYNNLSQSILEEYLKGFAKIEPPLGIKYIQIDAGYFKSAGDWLDHNHLWPDGLKAAFEIIKKYGFKPGIWIAPFMVGNRSELYKDHPDWVLYTKDGKPVTPWKWYNEPKVWGYRDEEYYVLDTSHPEAMEYIRKVFRTMREWGAEFFKTDFMLWGIQDSSKVKRFKPGKTSIEYFRKNRRESSPIHWRDESRNSAGKGNMC